MSKEVLSRPLSYPFDQGKAGAELHPLYDLIGPGVHRVHLVQADEDAFMVTGHALLRQVLEDEATFRLVDENLPGLPRIQGTLLGMSGADHRRVRRPAVAAFTVRAVRERLPGIRAEVAGRLAALAALNRPVDLVGEFALPLVLAVLCEALGVPEDDRHLFPGWGDRFLDLADPRQGEQAAAEMCAYLAGAVERRGAAEPGPDVLSRYAHTEHGRRVGGQEAVAAVMSVVVAGWESTAGLIASMCHYLLTHLDQWERLVADPGLADTAVHELLRTRPVASDDGPARRATRDTVLGGVAVPAGSLVLAARDAANLDAARFPDPRTVDLGRPDADGNLAFGSGSHACLGRNLAIAILHTVLVELATGHPGVRLTGEPVPWLEDASVRRPERLAATLA